MTDTKTLTPSQEMHMRTQTGPHFGASAPCHCPSWCAGDHEMTIWECCGPVIHERVLGTSGTLTVTRSQGETIDGIAWDGFVIDYGETPSQGDCRTAAEALDVATMLTDWAACIRQSIETAPSAISG